MNTVKEIAHRIEKTIKENNIVLFTTSTISDKFETIKGILDRDQRDYFVFKIDEDHQCDLIKEELTRMSVGKKIALPVISIHGVLIGSYNDIIRLYHTDELFNDVQGKVNSRYNYDLIIVGGGSGGIAAAKEAELHKMKVAIFDYVKPTNHGTVWKEGGTALNVGSIPKKLMYCSSKLHDFYTDSENFGWELQVDKRLHNWQKMFRNIQNHIKNIRMDELQVLNKERIDFFNAFVNFKDKHTIKATDKNGNVINHTANVFILSTGSHTELPKFTGSNLVITSEDLFMLPYKPGKTLLVGAECITLELAGILNSFGIDCAVITNKSTIMKDCDSEMVDTIINHLISNGVRILTDCEIVEIISTDSLSNNSKQTTGSINTSLRPTDSLSNNSKQTTGSINTTQISPVVASEAITNQSSQNKMSANQKTRRLSRINSVISHTGPSPIGSVNKTASIGQVTSIAPFIDVQYKVKTVRMIPNSSQPTENEEYFDLVVLAGKRRPSVKDIGLEKVGVKLNENNFKVLVDEFDRTTCSSIFAIGDVQCDCPDSASVAEKSAKLLVRRMCGEIYKMEYDFIPVAVFTPLEYSYCGYSEQQAREIYGDTSIEKYYSNFVPLEWGMRSQNRVVCCVKLICLKTENSRVIGLHILGPNASEITQGFALGMKAMVTKNDFDRLTGIYTTCATIFTNLRKV